MKKINHKQFYPAGKFVAKMLRDPEVRALYEKERLKTEIAMAIKMARTRAHLTQSQLAKKAETTQGVISRIESGTDERTTTVPLMARIAKACGATFKFEFKFKRAA